MVLQESALAGSGAVEEVVSEGSRTLCVLCNHGKQSLFGDLSPTGVQVMASLAGSAQPEKTDEVGQIQSFASAVSTAFAEDHSWKTSNVQHVEQNFEEPYALMRASTDLWEPRGAILGATRSAA